MSCPIFGKSPDYTGVAFTQIATTSYLYDDKDDIMEEREITEMEKDARTESKNNIRKLRKMSEIEKDEKGRKCEWV